MAVVWLFSAAIVAGVYHSWPVFGLVAVLALVRAALLYPWHAWHAWRAARFPDGTSGS